MYIKVGIATGTRGRSSSDMFGKIVLALSALAWASAQIPNLGFCPDYVPMANFDMRKFMGVWYEAERYFQLSEVVSRCVMTNYTKGIDGKYRVSNQVTSRFTGIKRILEGEIKPAASKAEEGKFHVKYTTVPLTPETRYSVLETDYDSYAVLWSCQGIGPVHAQNAWVMTRERIPAGEVLQKAYGVLDKYKISKTFFVKTDQADCAYLEAPINEDNAAKTTKRKSQVAEKNDNVRSAVPAEDVGTQETMEAEASEDQAPSMADAPKVIAEIAKPYTVETVPERILKVAETVKEESAKHEVKLKHETAEIKQKNGVENATEERNERPTETKETA